MQALRALPGYYHRIRTLESRAATAVPLSVLEAGHAKGVRLVAGLVEEARTYQAKDPTRRLDLVSAVRELLAVAAPNLRRMLRTGDGLPPAAA